MSQPADSFPIYLDHNATTAPLPDVIEVVSRTLRTHWANASSMHEPGQDARRLLVESRARVAAAFGCQPAEVVFTSGATESNHQAVLGALARGRALGRHRIVLSAVEHPGLMALAEQRAVEGVPVDFIPVDAQGRLNLAAARALIGPDVALLSVMAANNETGVLMPLAELSALARAHDVPFHVDATQLAGKHMLRFADSGADLWSLSAHKFHGPKGVGALLVRKGLQWPALFVGKQERNRRGGTENLPGIVGMAAAAQAMAASLEADIAHMQSLRVRLEAGLRAAHPALQIVGDEADRLANTVCVRVGEIDAERTLGKLERAGVIASSGAACTSAGTQPSHVLLAMGATPKQAKACVRLSLCALTTAEEIEKTLETVRQVVVPLLQEEMPVPA